MQRVMLFAILAISMNLSASPVAADEALEKMIKARQGYYQMLRHNAGQLIAMAKGEADYDAKKAESAATNLQILSTLDLGSLYLPGSSKEEMPGKTRALKKIWDDFAAVKKKGAAHKKAVKAMAANAGKGLDALKANAGALGEGCKGCHDNFRADKF